MILQKSFEYVDLLSILETVELCYFNFFGTYYIFLGLKKQNLFKIEVFCNNINYCSKFGVSIFFFFEIDKKW